MQADHDDDHVVRLSRLADLANRIPGKHQRLGVGSPSGGGFLGELVLVLSDAVAKSDDFAVDTAFAPMPGFSSAIGKMAGRRDGEDQADPEPAAQHRRMIPMSRPHLRAR